MNKGFLLVASRNKPYLTAAQILADSIKEYFPESHITVFTEKAWTDDPGNFIFDNVFPIEINPKNILESTRYKLYALPQTPYDITCYIDVDVVCKHSDIKYIFDGLGNNDIVFTKIRPYAAAATWWDTKKEFGIHGGFFVYKKSEKMISFLNQWWENWKYHVNRENFRWEGKYDEEKVRFWDQFPLWLMLKDKEDEWFRPDIKWNWIFDGKKEGRWNCMSNYIIDREDFNEDEIVFFSYSSDRFRDRWQ